ncbi:MAG TPA: PTS mannitol transporter subunit IICB [Candidatus Acidoferrales bacterium]|nr:PTS mannitol transporter subunit IICB [Candidatus Acidoferrales bacterium]
MQERIQRFGGNLASMVIPNIGAFIAWGLITAFVIPTGWTPNETLAKLVGPMITFLLPLLIGYTGGKLVYGHRGGVVGAIVTAGIIVGSSVPMFLGAMIVGPLGGYLIKKFDEATGDKIPSGFEMLTNNFSAGILGAILAVLGLVVVGPVLDSVSNFLGGVVKTLVDARLLPLADIPIEVGKVLFLNNAINHGVLAPLGVIDAAKNGRAIEFMLETDPGPGLGLLMAFWFAGKGLAKASAPGAIIIHFLGGIHEIYFPYVLSNPVMIVALWAGGLTADTIWVLTGAGLVATPSPGSIFAYLAVTPPGQHFNVLLGVFAAAIVSFVVGTAILRFIPVKQEDTEQSSSLGTIPGSAPAPA